MPKIRNIPFAYQMVNGKIVPQQEQAQIVQMIFEDYAEGKTVPDITQNLQLCSVPYSEGAEWNKNMVCRILDDARYIGDKSFPEIITNNLFSTVQVMRKQSCSGRLNPSIRPLRNKVVCACCGTKLSRQSHGSKRPLEWNCEQCSSRVLGISDSDVLYRVYSVADYIIKAPENTYFASGSNKAVSISLIKMNREFERDLSNPKMDEERLLQLARQIAQEQYALCSAAETYANNRWLSMLIKKWREGQLSKEQFIQQAVQEIQLSVNGQISVRLVNNKTL